MSIYLDYAAATPMSDGCLKAIQPFFAENFYNASAIYLAGKAVKRDLEEARHKIAMCLGAQAPEIIFTAGATEANNLAVRGIMERYEGSEIALSAIEHESVLAPAGLYKNRVIKVQPNGLVGPPEVARTITDKTVLVSIMLVNNEIGTVQPMREINRILQQIRVKRQRKGIKLPLYLHTDAAQAGCYLDLQVHRLGVDLLSINGGKIYGPKQSGALYVKAGTEIEPLIFGGGQERGLRSGTENTAFAIGLAYSLEDAQKHRDVERERVQTLLSYFAKELQKNFPKSVINGSQKHRAPHILSITFPGADNERLMMQLDEANVVCAIGSACSAASDEPSQTLSAIGLSATDARSSLRFSFGRQTTQKQLDDTIKTLAKFLQ